MTFNYDEYFDIRVLVNYNTFLFPPDLKIYLNLYRNEK